MRLRVGFATAAMTALGLVSLMQARRHPGDALAGGSEAALALQFGAALGAWGAGLFIVARGHARASGALLMAMAVAVPIAGLPLPGSGGAVLFTLALVAGATVPALAGAAASARGPADRVVAAAALAVTGLLLGLLPAATFDPRSTGCFACPRNLILIRADASLHDRFWEVGLYAGAVTCAALAVLAAVRGARHAIRRSIIGPVVLGGATTAALGAATFAYEAPDGVRVVDVTTQGLWLAQCACLAAAAVGVAGQSLAARRVRHRLAGMVAEVLPDPEQLRSALAAGLGDPGLEIVFARAGHGAVDSRGRPAPMPGNGVAVTDVARRGEVMAQLRHARELASSPERVREAAVGAGLGLEHAWLRANARAELADLVTSRERIVEIGDAERRRLERNLHDGAQQRLIGISVALQATPGTDPALQRAREEMREALENLRAIAHGIHSISLTEAGLAGAVDELSESSRVPLRVTVAPGRRASPAAEAAAYRLVLDGVRCAERQGDGGPVAVAIACGATELAVRVVLPGVPVASAELALEHAADRVAALTGTLTIGAEASGAVAEASVPCAS